MEQLCKNPRHPNHPYPFDLAEKARKSRCLIVEMLTHAKSSHIGCAFSVVDILTVLYHAILDVKKIKEKHPLRDYVFLSKGHAASALYATLMTVGCVPEDLVPTYNKIGSPLCGHPIKDSLPGIEASTGSLGHGLSMAVGFALACKKDNKPNHFYVILGDGECQEGAIWEALMVAARYHLNNITIIVDANKLQGIDRTNDVVVGGLEEKFKAFGCYTKQVDGHDYNQLLDVLSVHGNLVGPLVVIANTIKGKGISFIEDKLEWHYRSLNPEQYSQAKAELEKVCEQPL